MCQILSMRYRGRFYTANGVFLDYEEHGQSNFAVKNEQAFRNRHKIVKYINGNKVLEKAK